MPETVATYADETKTHEELVEEVARLRWKVDDLAEIVGNLMFSIYGSRWEEHNPQLVEPLKWQEEAWDEGTEDACLCGVWVYHGDA